MKSTIKQGLLHLNAMRWRLRANGPNPPRFSGAFATREDALASQQGKALVGYDHDEVTDVSFDAMCNVMPWDYPILFWLQKFQGHATRIVDAGGHMATKYVAFDRLIDVSGLEWTVYDLEAIVKAGRKRQEDGLLPQAIRFESDLATCPAADVLLASGLLQYLDQPLAELVQKMQSTPRHIFLNKVAMRDGPAVFTLEQIGLAKVPYNIRNRADFESEIATIGYHVSDTWKIPELSHIIATHPMLGASESRGYILERA